MSRIRKKQLCTSLLLVLVIAACMAGGTYLRRERSVYAPAATQEPAAVQTERPSANMLLEEQEQALARYEAHKNEERAQTLTSAQNCSQKAALMFTGVCSGSEAGRLMTSLRACGTEAMFFLTQQEIASAQEMVAAIRASGFEVGVLNAGGSAQLDGERPESVIKGLTSAGAAMQTAFGVRPTALLALGGLDEETPYAAYAASYDQIYVPTRRAETAEYATRDRAASLVAALTRGSLLAVELTDGSVDAAVLLAEALEETDLNVKAAVLTDQTEKKGTPGALSGIHTIERAVSFIFSGMSSDEELRGVLRALSDVQGVGIFLLTVEELEQEEQAIRQIQSAGHRLGLATVGQGSQEALLQELLAGQELLRQRYGIREKVPVFCTIGKPNENLLAAAAAGGFTVLAADVMATRTQDAWATDAAAVVEGVLPASWGVLRRGEIVGFSLGIYQNSAALLGEVVRLIATERNIYTIRPATDIAANTQMCYTYPVPEDKILPEVKDRIHPGQLVDKSFEELCSRYIGIDWVERAKFLPGFTDQEIRALDKKGVIPDAGNRVFLTFDDWGTDETLEKLLDVLRAHNAKATFFIRTKNVENNPNLVRAIAAEGHAVGSHTDTHFPLANQQGSSYTELTGEQAAALQQDVTTSYQKLQRIIGDMQTDGVPSLCRVFRPPTLAMSRKGLEAILDCGFSVSLSGSYTTQDYKAKDAESIFRDLRRYTKPGAVLIMHMSDNSAYTAEALEMYLTYMEKYVPEYEFCRVSDVL